MVIKQAKEEINIDIVVLEETVNFKELFNKKMKDEYIIINKTAIQKRIEELEKEIQEHIKKAAQTGDYDYQSEDRLDEVNQILSQSTPLVPEIEKAFDAGRTVKNYKGEWQETYSDVMTSAKYEESKDYISNLKLDI